MTKPNLPTEKKLPTKAESLLAQASATVKKEAERKSALTAAGVKDIAKYDSAYAPLKNFDKDISSLYTEINDLGRFYTASDTELGKAKTNAQKMKSRIGQINSFLDTYGNLYDENTIKAMRSDLKSIDSTLTDWLTKASADDYLTQLNSPASVDTALVATAIRDKESERARAERGGRDTTEITNELNALYDNGGAYGAAAKRRNEYNANKVALATAKAELEKIAEGDPVERQKAWENGTSYQYEQEIANRLTEKRAEIDALEAKIRLYEDNEYADNVWLKVYGSGEDLSKYRDIEYKTSEDPIRFLTEGKDASKIRNEEIVLTDEERMIYNYLLKNRGAKAAKEWLSSYYVSDERNQRLGKKAGEALNNIEGKFWRSALTVPISLSTGLEQFATGVTAPIMGKQPTSVTAYAQQEATKDLGVVGKAINDAAVSIGNMAPSIALGAINPIAGQASFGASAAGNAYNEARKEGKTVGQAALYGIVSGALEVFLQNILGGIPGISGASSKLANAAKNLKKPALRALAVYGIDAVGEATEEYLQEILDPMFRNVIFNEDNEIKIYTDEAAYSAMLGALTAVILNSPQLLNTVKTSKLGEGFINSGWYDDLVDNALKLDKSTDAYDLALKLKSGELNVTGDNVGELVRAYKADRGDLSFTEKGGTVEKMPDSVVTESVENLKTAEAKPAELTGEALVLDLVADGEVSNSKAKKILEDAEAMAVIGANVDGLDTISKKRAVIKEALQNYIAQNAEKIASNAQNKSTTQTEGKATTEAQGKDADTFQYAHIVDKQKLGTRLIGELKNRTNKAGEKLADKLVAMATSITKDDDANRAVYKMFANPRYASAAALLHTDDVLEIVRNLETNSGKDFARKYMSNLTNATAFAAEWTKLLREDVNVTLENAVGMKPAENAKAPSGYYDESDHRVAIADNLLTFEKVIGTIAHEGFHANGAIDRELVNNFAAYLKDNLYKNDWDTKVKLKKEKIEAYTGKPTTTEKAIEEVCAETITKLFNTQKAWDVMAEMFGNIEGSNRYLNRVKATVDRVYNNFKKMFGGKVPESKLTTFRDHLEHLIKETKGYNPNAETAEESKTEAKKEAKATTKASDAKLEAELEAELAAESEQTAKPEKNASVGNKMKPTESEAETKKAPVEDEEVELVSDLYDAEAKGGRMYSVSEIFGGSGTSYGIGVNLDSTLLDNLTEDERVEMLKEYVKELGGQPLTAYDSNGNKIEIIISRPGARFRNKQGKRVPATKDLLGKQLNTKVKQESIALVDELVLTAKYDSSASPKYSHGWLDGYGKNDWEYWRTHVKDKNGDVWEATLNIANTARGEKVLYDIGPIKKVEGFVKPNTTSTNSNIPPSTQNVNTPNSNSAQSHSSSETDVLLPDTDITHPDITSHSMRRDLTTLESAKDTSGGRLYNYKAMEADEEEYRRMLKKHGGLADNKIEELFNTVDAIVDRIKETIESDAELAKAIDFGWERDIDDRAYSPIKQNSDKLYKVSLDFSTMCRKRILQQITQSQIQEAMDKTLDAKESIAVRQALAKLIDMGFQIEVACKLCYVESARLKSPAQIKKFLENKEQVLIEFLGGKSAKVAVKEAEMAIREKLGVGNTPLKQLDHDTAEKIREVKRKTKAEYKPSAEESKYLETIRTLTRKDFTTPEGLENLAKNHYEIFNAYTSYVRNATKSKAVENDTWFRAGDTAAIGDKLIANMNTENGLRSQSWSDFQVIHLLDYIAATIELSTRGAKEQVYTKVPDFVKLMHGTNAMINLSLIPAKEYNGKLEYDKVEGMAFDIAMKLREKYPDVAGTICIGIANEQIQKLLASEDIDYVIPYHSSALNKHLRKAMDIPTWEDYQSYQTEKQISETEAKAMGVKIDKEHWHKAPSFSEWFDLKTAKEIAKSAKHGKYGVMTGAYMAMQNAADNYKRLCAERGLLPKFSYGKADFSNEENYWKLLIDRKMINQETGEIIEQKPLTPIFNLDEITEIMDDAIAQYPTVSKHQDAATEVVTKLFVEGKVRGDMSAEDIYSAVEKAVREETDNTTVYNILESAKDLDGRMYSAEDTDIEETPFDSVNEYRKELARIYKDGYAEGKTEEEIDREADEFTRAHNARLAAQFGTIKQGEKPAREVAIPKRTSKEEKVSQTPRTLEEALATPEEILPTIERMVANGTFSYEPMSNKKLVEKAKDKIGTTQDSFNDALKLWQKDGKLVAADQIVMGWVLYDEAVKKKEYATATEICVDMVARERTLGQGLQAGRVLKMLTPAGQVKAAVRVANNLTDQLVKEGRLARKRFSDKDKDSVEKIRKFAKRKGEEKVGDQLDKIGRGEQTETWANEVRSILAENISRRIKPLNQATMLTARGVANDLMAFAEKTLPKTAPRTAAERIRDFFANRKEYIKAWNEAKDVLKEKYKNDANSLKILEEFFNATVEDRADTVMMRAVAEVALNKDTDIRTMMQKAELGDIKSVIDEIYNKLQTVVDAKGADATLLRLAVQRWVTEKYVATHPLTQKQIDALIRKKLTQACGNINSIIRQNGTYKGEQLQMITAMLINEFGISNEAAITAAEKISERYNFVLDKASQIALKSAIKERKTGEKKSLNELFEQYANMGAFTGDYNEAVTAKLFDREGIKVNTALAEAYLAATTEEGRKEALYAIYKDLGSQMPSTFADKFNAWRYLAMLGNLRTHVRNVLGNAVFAPVVLTKDLIATGIEQGLQAATKGKFEASKSLGVFKDGLWEAAMKDAKLMSDVISSGQKYEDLVSANEAIKEGRVIFDKKYLKWVEYLRKKNSELLETEDVIFSSRHYAFALAQYCSAKGITSEDVANGKIPDEARAYAIKEAQKATFRDLNWFSKKLSGLRVRGDNALSKAANIAIEGVLPFKKTPANILVRGFEYGPAGLVKSIYDMIATVRKGEMSASEAIDEMSAGLTGTGLLLLGMLLASKGLVEGASDDDEKKAEFDELTGHQSYALVLGNKTFTIDWLAPAALPFFVGVEIAKLREREGVYTMAGITDIVLDVMGPMLELSCLQSLNDLIDSVRYAKENEAPMVALATAATGYFTQIFPTLLGQTERVGENKRMQTFTNKDSWLTSDAQYLLGKISAKIPGVDYQQIPYIDAWGRVEETGGIVERALNNYINPSYVSEVKVSAMEQELQRLYEATKGENNISVYPKRAEKHFTVRRENPVTGEKEYEDYYLSADEYVQYATAKGTTAYKTITAFMEGPIYNTLDDKEKARAISSLYSYAEEYARTTITDHEPEGLTKRAMEAAEQGIDFDTFFNAYVVQSSVEADKDFLGDAVTNSASNKKIDAINKITADPDERLILYKELDVGITAQNDAILDDAIDAKINGDTTAYDAAIERYIINNKGVDKKSATAEYEKRIAEIRKDLAKLSYDDPAEYERQLEYYRSGAVAKYFSASKMSDSKKEWLDSYTDSLARKLKKHDGDAKKTELIYAEAAKYGINERELKKRADKLK